MEKMESQHDDVSKGAKSLELIATIKTRATKRAIAGVTIVKDKFYIANFNSTTIEIYDLESLAFLNSLELSSLGNAYDMKYCNTNDCLYIMDSKGPNEISRITLKGEVLKTWTIGMGYGCISVTFDSNVLLATYNEGRIEEYSPNGETMERFVLSAEAGFPHSRYAIKLHSGRYLISHGEGDDPCHRVCVVDRNGNVFASFGGERGSNTNQLNVPIFLDLYSDKSLVVIDRDNSRLLLLDSKTLTLRKILIPAESYGLERPERVALDEARGRIFVVHNGARWKECCVFVFKCDHISKFQTDSSLNTPIGRVMADRKLPRDKSITQNRDVLLHSLDVNGILLAELVGNGVLDEATRQHILSKATRILKNQDFLDWLMKCSPKAIDKVMDALKKDDQVHLVNLIEGRQDGVHVALSPLTRARLFTISGDLTDSIRVDHGLLDYMVSKEALNMRHRQVIMSKSTGSEKNLELIETVLRRSKHTLNSLLSGLEETGQEHIADQIRLVLQDLFVTGNQLSVKAVTANDGGEKVLRSAESIKTQSKSRTLTAISGIAIVDQELFLTAFKHSDIGVNDLTTLEFIRSLKIDDLVNPWDMKYCTHNRCLYIMDTTYVNWPNTIFRLTPDGKRIKVWTTESGYGCISVTYDFNVLLATHDKDRIEEYSPDGELIRKIVLLPEAGFFHPSYAIKISNDRFLVSHGEGDDPLHRVCMVDSNGDIRVAFGGRRGSSTNQFDVPIHLTFDSEGSIIVIDRDNSRVLLLESDYLEFKRELIARGRDGMLRPERMTLDETGGRIFIAHNDPYWDECCIFVFKYV